MRLLANALMSCALLAGAAYADLPSDSEHGTQVATLAVPASKHWVWVNDFVFPHMADGMAYLVDGDTGRYLGTLSTGYSFAHLHPVARRQTHLFAGNLFLARHARHAHGRGHALRSRAPWG